MEDWAPVGASIAEATGRAPGPLHARPVTGGCIHRAVVLEGPAVRFFVKSNARAHLDGFIAEAEGLRALARAGAVRVPAPICWGTAGDVAYLVLEHLTLDTPSARAQEALGRRLAALHRVTRPRFGWDRDNTIGLTPQPNAWSDDWVSFFRDRRIGFQLACARQQGYRRLADAGERLQARVETLLQGHTPPASLLHGDLWSGNVAQLPSGEPVIFDPAVYYGDREADLAMTELFGRFDERFYRAYTESWPPAPGYEIRRDLYNLYHVLNHVNLFGGAYLGQAERLIGRLLAQAG